MKILLEAAVILTAVLAVGALGWAAMGMMAGGNINPDVTARAARAEGATRALVLACGALVAHLLVRRIQKGRR